LPGGFQTLLAIRPYVQGVRVHKGVGDRHLPVEPIRRDPSLLQVVAMLPRPEVN
jgi:hypothetical protein